MAFQSATNNPHVAEERNVIVEDNKANEEDKSVQGNARVLA